MPARSRGASCSHSWRAPTTSTLSRHGSRSPAFPEGRAGRSSPRGSRRAPSGRGVAQPGAHPRRRGSSAARAGSLLVNTTDPPAHGRRLGPRASRRRRRADRMPRELAAAGMDHRTCSAWASRIRRSLTARAATESREPSAGRGRSETGAAPPGPGGGLGMQQLVQVVAQPFHRAVLSPARSSARPCEVILGNRVRGPCRSSSTIAAGAERRPVALAARPRSRIIGDVTPVLREEQPRTVVWERWGRHAGPRQQSSTIR